VECSTVFKGFHVKRVVCTVIDSATELHGQPMFGPAIGGILRSFVDEVNRAAADNALYSHPDDYTLVYVSDFDDESGVFSEPDGGRRVLARGKDVAVRKE